VLSLLAMADRDPLSDTEAHEFLMARFNEALDLKGTSADADFALRGYRTMILAFASKLVSAIDREDPKDQDAP